MHDKHPSVITFTEISELYGSTKLLGTKYKIGQLVQYCTFAANGKTRCICPARVIGYSEENREKGTVFVLDLAFETSVESVYMVHEGLRLIAIDSRLLPDVDLVGDILIDANHAELIVHRLIG